MKQIFTLSLLALLAISCKKNNGSTQDNGPIGGNYNYTGTTITSYDTMPGSGIQTITLYTTTTTNLKGTLTITKDKITNKGLMYDFNTTGTRKEVNTSTGATNTNATTPITGSSGATTTSYSSTYAINTSTAELNIPTGELLFSASFIPQPATKKYKYTLSANVLTIISEQYAPSSFTGTSSYRVIHEARFQKQ